MLPGLLPLCLLLALGEVGRATAQQCKLVLQQDLQITNPKTQTPGISTQIPSPTSTRPVSTASPSSTSNITTFTPFNYGAEKVRGVNLGGWFVLEPWITPSIFQGTNNTNVIDEYTFGQLMGADYAQETLRTHWETWITEVDFQNIRAAGLNHVRIPLGYWSVPITSAYTNYSTSVLPYTTGAWPYFLQALGWARNNSLHTIVDLHGAPGSQNGFDNSGQRGSPGWANGSDTVGRTLDIIKFIADQVGDMADVIELLNEPAGWVSDIGSAISGYWQDGYQVVRQAAGSGPQVMIEDAFLGIQTWENFMKYPNASGVIMDEHQYQIFNDDQLALSLSEHLSSSCQTLSQYASFAKSNMYTVMGEWSNAVTDCAEWLNGRGVGARWDGSIAEGQQVYGSCDGWTGSMSTFSDEYKAFLRQYWESQVLIGESVQGWVYWTWKAENADEWSYQKGLEGGWIPQDPTDLMYPNMCSSANFTAV
ncbi:glycoside hydrolase [Sparassis latifolia]